MDNYFEIALYAINSEEKYTIIPMPFRRNKIYNIKPFSRIYPLTFLWGHLMFFYNNFITFLNSIKI